MEAKEGGSSEGGQGAPSMAHTESYQAIKFYQVIKWKKLFKLTNLISILQDPLLIQFKSILRL